MWSKYVVSKFFFSIKNQNKAREDHGKDTEIKAVLGDRRMDGQTDRWRDGFTAKQSREEKGVLAHNTNVSKP